MLIYSMLNDLYRLNVSFMCSHVTKQRNQINVNYSRYLCCQLHNSVTHHNWHRNHQHCDRLRISFKYRDLHYHLQCHHHHRLYYTFRNHMLDIHHTLIILIIALLVIITIFFNIIRFSHHSFVDIT